MPKGQQKTKSGNLCNKREKVLQIGLVSYYYTQKIFRDILINKINSRILRSAKDKRYSRSTSVIYPTPYSCASILTGRTNQSVNTILKEHKGCWPLIQTNRAVGAENILSHTDHHIKSVESPLLTNTTAYDARLYKELIELYKQKNNLNKEKSGVTRHKTWMPRSGK